MKTHATLKPVSEGDAGRQGMPIDDSKTCHVARKGPKGANQNALRRLKRAEGQVRGVIRMVEDEVYCPEILTQIAAARSALRKAGLEILKRHVESCVSDAIRSEDDGGEALIEEMMEVLDRHGI